MKNIYLTIILFLFSISAFSQTTSKSKKIETLLELTGSGKLGVQVLTSMVNSFKTRQPNIPSEFWDKFLKEVKPIELIALVVPIYDKYYTEEEINQLISFYESPIGKKVIETTPNIMQESMNVGRIWGEEIAKKVTEMIKKEGY